MSTALSSTDAGTADKETDALQGPHKPQPKEETEPAAESETVGGRSEGAGRGSRGSAGTRPRKQRGDDKGGGGACVQAFPGIPSTCRKQNVFAPSSTACKKAEDAISARAISDAIYRPSQEQVDPVLGNEYFPRICSLARMSSLNHHGLSCHGPWSRCMHTAVSGQRSRCRASR